MLLIERKHLLPALHGLLYPITGAVNGKESVSGALEHVELIFLAMTLELLFSTGDIGR